MYAYNVDCRVSQKSWVHICMDLELREQQHKVLVLIATIWSRFVVRILGVLLILTKPESQAQSFLQGDLVHPDILC